MFIRMGNYLHRPSQSDCGHLDWWVKGENKLIDAGSYKYSSVDFDVSYFSGVVSHNTFSINDSDHMDKGPNFIWYNWPKVSNVESKVEKENYSFSGICSIIIANKPIMVKRTVIKKIGESKISVQDELLSNEKFLLKQSWNFLDKSIKFELDQHENDAHNSRVETNSQQGYYSLYYGAKHTSNQIIFSTTDKFIGSVISVEKSS
jgi:hypothetical protein